ncbi:RusA family crossover junction endodeoxyribonuclease [Acinetobacter variabilis]|uniref:RusA family crossover junction endodeoxyribonuclease n=1 Tax=Acinetobacter variabilis TaxID=70346 RepID=UPI002898A8C9|nr:RusA family crossover junction endodeoxyribonuclease [Acinetobacter variabilis]
MGTRWSEKQLEVHLNKHKFRKECASVKFKNEIDAKTREAEQNAVEANLERNSVGGEKVLLDFNLPAIPPSVNHYWKKSGSGFKLSDEARDFHDLVSMLVPRIQTAARLKLEVTFHFPNRLRRDIDNYLKATIDSLVKCEFCVDDEQFDELLVRRGAVVKGGLLKIKVWEI